MESRVFRFSDKELLSFAGCGQPCFAAVVRTGTTHAGPAALWITGLLCQKYPQLCPLTRATGSDKGRFEARSVHCTKEWQIVGFPLKSSTCVSSTKKRPSCPQSYSSFVGRSHTNRRSGGQGRVGDFPLTPTHVTKASTGANGSPTRAGDSGA